MFLFHDIIQVFPNKTEVRTEVKDQYFHPIEVYKSGIGPFLKGLLVKPQNRVSSSESIFGNSKSHLKLYIRIAKVDPFFVDAVRNLLYQPFGKSFGLDLAAIDIERGRDNGIQVR